ncbi:hypothetical protein CLOSTMETH_02273 [[Clostridium] methylpentosum DSM 5476]|uniref:UPF0291 protein CLOSTMETH_02273 n=1 Tax=[Clostridium] methylpentosum DSM 5476 TaxID=537013 RepID=C0EEI7_9FIRM|nr:hypothetical protein CLOSTMETH_02273 [[Clostridium] methylpentosum DSM 5476]MDY3990000.1 DUF896 domain-containing protein [Massilioclostridium sp.]MEE1492040.1 DUF896 domain-containing protein [Massilioclostridium sp.]
MHELIEKINALAKKARTEGLTPAETEERDRLRQEYLRQFRAGFKEQLMGVKIVDAEGNDITPQKLKEEQEKRKNK